MNTLILYFSGGIKYILPREFIFTYIIGIIRYVFAGYIIATYFQVDYTVITMAMSVLVADYVFFANTHDYLDLFDDEE